MTAVQFLSKCYPCNYLLDSTGGSIYDGGVAQNDGGVAQNDGGFVRHPER